MTARGIQQHSDEQVMISGGDVNGPFLFFILSSWRGRAFHFSLPLYCSHSYLCRRVASWCCVVFGGISLLALMCQQRGISWCHLQ